MTTDYLEEVLLGSCQEGLAGGGQALHSLLLTGQPGGLKGKEGQGRVSCMGREGGG